MTPVVTAMVEATVYALGSPLGSTAVSSDALKVLQRLAQQLPNEMQAPAHAWAPALCRFAAGEAYRARSESVNESLTGGALQLLEAAMDILLPPPPALCKALAADVDASLADCMLENAGQPGGALHMARLWALVVRLVGGPALQQCECACAPDPERVRAPQLVSRLVKVLDVTFDHPDAAVRLATQVRHLPPLAATCPPRPGLSPFCLPL
eukprot:jgi/Mesen1/137/ME1128845C07546